MSWFGHWIHKFEHVLRHVGAIAADIAATGFGFPPGAGFVATELLMRAHAGDHHARAKVARLAQRPKMRAFMGEIARHLRAHPHFEAMRGAAVNAHAHAAAPAPPHEPLHAIPAHGIAAAPLPPSAFGHLAHAPHAAGLTQHPTWPTAPTHDTGRVQIVGEMGPPRPMLGHAPHEHTHHAHARYGGDTYGIEWLLGEQDSLESVASADDGEPEPWRTPRPPGGIPGV